MFQPGLPRFDERMSPRALAAALNALVNTIGARLSISPGGAWNMQQTPAGFMLDMPPSLGYDAFIARITAQQGGNNAYFALSTSVSSPARTVARSCRSPRPRCSFNSASSRASMPASVPGRPRCSARTKQITFWQCSSSSDVPG